MLEFGDSVYFIDLKAFEKAITVANPSPDKTYVEKETKVLTDRDGNIITTEYYEKIVPNPREIDATKYEILKTFIELIIDYNEPTDEKLGGNELDETPLSYKIVFNTLFKEGIIKEQ